MIALYVYVALKYFDFGLLKDKQASIAANVLLSLYTASNYGVFGDILQMTHLVTSFILLNGMLKSYPKSFSTPELLTFIAIIGWYFNFFVKSYLNTSARMGIAGNN